MSTDINVYGLANQNTFAWMNLMARLTSLRAIEFGDQKRLESLNFWNF